jgi:hypothetical protein
MTPVVAFDFESQRWSQSWTFVGLNTFNNILGLTSYEFVTSVQDQNLVSFRPVQVEGRRQRASIARR